MQGKDYMNDCLRGLLALSMALSVRTRQHITVFGWTKRRSVKQGKTQPVYVAQSKDFI